MGKPIRIRYGAGEHHFADLRLPKCEQLHPVVIVIHGGFWKRQYGLDLMDAMSDDLTERGFATWNIEYSRVGHEGGGYPGTLIDVGRAVDHLREIADEYRLDLGHVYTIGHSAGGHLALWTAGRHRLPAGSVVSAADPLPIHGAVSLAGANDLHLMWEVRQVESPVVGFLGGTPGEVPERYALASPAQLLPLGVPQALIHGLDDVDVPPVLSTSYREQAVAAGDQVELKELAGVEHFKVIDPASEAWPPIVAALLNLHGK